MDDNTTLTSSFAQEITTAGDRYPTINKLKFTPKEENVWILYNFPSAFKITKKDSSDNVASGTKLEKDVEYNIPSQVMNGGDGYIVFFQSAYGIALNCSDVDAIFYLFHS